MDYSQRFTEIIGDQTEEIETEPTYLIRAEMDVIAKRLGLYEDLGFSPVELAQILLGSDSITPDQKDLIRVALARSRKFDEKGHYLREAYAV